MTKIVKHAARDAGFCLVGPEFLPPGEDELSMRDGQQMKPRVYRALNAAEIEKLTQAGSSAADWGAVLVHANFNPRLVRNCRFMGIVRIGALDPLLLEFDGVRLPVGLYNSTIVSCDIGDHVVVDHVSYLAHTIVGDGAILHNVGRVQTTPRARFGNGALREGEEPAQRAWMEVGNENGGRRIAPFAGMQPADAWLWSRYRDEKALVNRFEAMTDERVAPRGGTYSTIGAGTVIRDCRTLLDVAIGPSAVVEGANRIENVTIRSDEHEGAWIGDGVELVDGIVGYGCRVVYGSKAVRFVLGTNSRLLFGARLLHSFVGDNSTIACCEVQHSLILPNHEQHHNNSFLIAATLGGQSNIAAGATLGSNHNSRAPDGELLAGRGFWPGLCTSFKYPSRFASFVLVATGAYPHELNVTLPFSLVSQGAGEGGLRVAPAWAFMHNMYAVQRNGWKFEARDKRAHKEQRIEYASLAPDTIEEMLAAMEQLELWIGEAALRARNDLAPHDPPALRRLGRELLQDEPGAAAGLEILVDGIENSKRPTRILKAARGHAIYREMAQHYAVRVLVDFMKESSIADPRILRDALGGAPGSDAAAPHREREWVNMGGQIVPGPALARLRERIAEGRIRSWDELHGEYNLLWAEYPREKARHAMAVLYAMNGWNQPGARDPGPDGWREALERAAATARRIAEFTQASRAKDFTGPFRAVTYRGPAELTAVTGRAEEDALIVRVRQESAVFIEVLKALARRLGEPAAAR